MMHKSRCVGVSLCRPKIGDACNRTKCLHILVGKDVGPLLMNSVPSTSCFTPHPNGYNSRKRAAGYPKWWALEKVTPFKDWQFLVSMLDFWGCLSTKKLSSHGIHWDTTTCLPSIEEITRWWFQAFFMFTPILGKINQFWLIFFRWVGSTTNQLDHLFLERNMQNWVDIHLYDW